MFYLKSESGFHRNQDSLSLGFMVMGLAVNSNCELHLGSSSMPQISLNAYSKASVLLQKISICT